MLRTEFGMTAREAWSETPAWEVEALFEARARVIKEQERNR